MALKHKQGVYYCDINRLEELDKLSAIGNGEGLALSYALDVCNITKQI